MVWLDLEDGQEERYGYNVMFFGRRGGRRRKRACVPALGIHVCQRPESALIRSKHIPSQSVSSISKEY